MFVFRVKAQENFLEIDLLQQVYKKHTLWYRVYIVLIILISSWYILALAWFSEIGKTQKIQKNGIDIEIVFDVSYSMIAQDILPSRIDVAKKVFSDFIWALESDRVGLILFAGKPFQSVPLTYDYDFLKNFIDDMSVESVDQNNPILQGTAIGDALVLGSGVLSKENPEREKIIILITDGEANRGIEPELALKLLKEKNTKTYTIWVGKDEQTTIDIVVGWWFIQKSPVWPLDEKMLKKIAQETGGTYFRADSQEAFQNILDTIKKLEKSELEYQQFTFYNSLLYLILLCMIIPYIWVLYFVFIKKIHF